MALTKKNDLTDGAVIPSPQSPQPPSPSRFTVVATALRSTAAPVAAAATSVLTSPGKTTDITADDAPHDNASMVDPTLEEINYEEEEDNEDEEEDKDRDFPPHEDLYKINLFDSDDDNVSLGLSQYRVPSARGVGTGRRPKAGRPDKPDVLGMSEQEASFALLQWQASWKSDSDRDKNMRKNAEMTDLTIDYTGVVSDIMRTMIEVHASRLQVRHTFPIKEILLLRIVEEANLFGNSQFVEDDSCC